MRELAMDLINCEDVPFELLEVKGRFILFARRDAAGEGRLGACLVSRSHADVWPHKCVTVDLSTLERRGAVWKME